MVSTDPEADSPGPRRARRSWPSTGAICRSAAASSRCCARRSTCVAPGRRRRAALRRRAPSREDLRVVVPRRAPRVPRDATRSPPGRVAHLIARGSLGVPARRARGRAAAPRREGGRVTASDDARGRPVPRARRPGARGFAPRGARVEPGGPAYPFDARRARSRRAARGRAALRPGRRRAVGRDARHPVGEGRRRCRRRSSARVGQVMTFLAENELSALYVPAQFLPRIHPAYAETAMFLATQMADEARHIDVFLKRARAGGGRRRRLVGHDVALAPLAARARATSRRPRSCSSVLGEGTFLDLLRFVERPRARRGDRGARHARARADETRHVHFGLAHVRHALATRRRRSTRGSRPRSGAAPRRSTTRAACRRRSRTR